MCDIIYFSKLSRYIRIPCFVVIWYMAKMELSNSYDFYTNHLVVAEILRLIIFKFINILQLLLSFTTKMTHWELIKRSWSSEFFVFVWIPEEQFINTIYLFTLFSEQLTVLSFELHISKKKEWHIGYSVVFLRLYEANDSKFFFLNNQHSWRFCTTSWNTYKILYVFPYCMTIFKTTL